MGDERYYILTTKFAECLNRVLNSGRFEYLRRRQPDSGPFIDDVAKIPCEQRPSIQFVLFDRVPTSDTFKKLTGIYRLTDVVVNRAVEGFEGQDLYALLLERAQELDPPIAFGQGTPLWEELDTTRGRKTTTFYNGGRMLLPLPPEDFEAVLHHGGEQEAKSALDATSPVQQDVSAPGVSLPIESELHAYLAENLDLLEDGLQPFDPDNYVEYVTRDVGRIDLLCRDRDGNVVVVELKKGRADDAVVGQLARYIGWAKAELSQGAKVRGVIVANVISDRLRYASLAIPDVRLVSYCVKFELQTVL